MSFSSKAKSEICRIDPRRSCCKSAELAALIHTSGTVQLTGKKRISLKVSTENASIARRIFMLVKDLYNISPEVLVRKKRRLRKNNTYILLVSLSEHSEKILKDAHILIHDADGNMGIRLDINKDLVKKRCCKRSYLRGVFLGGGSVSDPEKAYHLEFIAQTQRYGESLCQFIQGFNIHAKLIERKNSYVVYIKEGEHIVNILSLIGAHSALLNFENIRIYKDMRNNINRIVNCETANLGKTINAAIRQIENIEYIRDNIGFSNLAPSLREIAELRVNYPDASLRELGELLSPKVGKSGINHRLRKLDKIAEDHRKNF
ncbi:MAG: DNA-binding protein WhiA [Caldicoprobacterales bacterium]|nr:DNA-binding protein WhiA [Clostridiales bacterium]